ncbi:VOC family protein [Chloroflexota bacterium]
MIKSIHHIALVVKNLDEALEVYDHLFQLKPSYIETVPEQGVRAAMLPIGGAGIELIESIDPNSTVAKFLEQHGEGIYHFSLEVDDIDEELKSLAAKGVELVDLKGRPGLRRKIGFLHPRSTKGVLLELAENL